MADVLGSHRSGQITRSYMVQLSFFEQVLEDQWCPALVPRLHELTAFRDLAEADRRVAESLHQGGDRGSRTLVIARQEYDPRDRFSASITRSWIEYCSFLNKSWKMSWPQVRPR